MRNLNRRLRKLESQITDSSGLIPDSPAWWKFWMEEARKTFETDYRPPKLIPDAVARVYLFGSESESTHTPSIGRT
jgi:hypothetical protein